MDNHANVNVVLLELFAAVKEMPAKARFNEE